MEPILAAALTASIVLLMVGHLIYPGVMVLSALTRRKSATFGVSEFEPTIAILTPAYNEEKTIARKIRNLAAMDYPRKKLKVVIGADGCTDETVLRAREAARSFPDLDIRILAFSSNRGKARVLNDLVTSTTADIVILTDASATMPPDAARSFVRWFADENVGAVGAGYEVSSSRAQSAASYWNFQTLIKIGESRLIGLNGAHGAGYAIRRATYELLPSDTINDDFIIPTQIKMNGFQTIYDPSIVCEENDHVGERDDFHRRKRIGAGNIQQLLRLARRSAFWRPDVALPALLTKGIKTITPYLLVLIVVLALLLAATPAVWVGAAIATALGVVLALLGATFFRSIAAFRFTGYLLKSLVAVGWGAGEYMLGVKRRPGADGGGGQYIPPVIRVAKRAIDVLGALAVLLFTAPFTPIIALAIKLESPGPVLFRQLRVGSMGRDRTALFEMIKFRSMRADAERATGAVWASEQDPRITRVGKFLRKTRLDEIPQMINVLRGDMSLIGPRPERPGFYSKLEAGVPFYAERTYGLRPGVTGLAQVSQGYDADIEDVRNKAMYDHAYAASLTSLMEWMKRDAAIIFRTLSVMALGRGQ